MNLLSKTKFQVFKRLQRFAITNCLVITKVCNQKVLSMRDIYFHLKDVANNLSLINSLYEEKVYFLERFHAFEINPCNRKNKNDFHLF